MNTSNTFGCCWAEFNDVLDDLVMYVMQCLELYDMLWILMINDKIEIQLVYVKTDVKQVMRLLHSFWRVCSYVLAIYTKNDIIVE